MRNHRASSCWVLAAIFLAGCIQQPPKEIKRVDSVVVGSDVKAVFVEACAKREELRAQFLRAGVGQKFGSDMARQEFVKQAGAKASQQTWTPVAEAMAARLDDQPVGDDSEFHKVLSELADGADAAAQAIKASK